MLKKIILALAFTLSLVTSAATTRVKILHFSIDISESYGEIFAFYDDLGDIDHFEWVIKHPQDPADPGEKDEFSVKDIQEGNVFKSGLPKRFVSF